MNTVSFYTENPLPSGVTALSLPQDFSTIAPGASSADNAFWISHDYDNAITNCKLYISPYSSGTYIGTTSAQDDFDTIIGWGDATTGGLQLNMDYTGGFLVGTDQYFTTASGGGLGTAITLSEEAIVENPGGDGIIPASDAACITLSIDVPAGATAGTLYVDLVMSYDCTT